MPALASCLYQVCIQYLSRDIIPILLQLLFLGLPQSTHVHLFIPDDWHHHHVSNIQLHLRSQSLSDGLAEIPGVDGGLRRPACQEMGMFGAPRATSIKVT